MSCPSPPRSIVLPTRFRGLGTRLAYLHVSMFIFWDSLPLDYHQKHAAIIPRPQLEPTARGSSEKTSRSLRPTKGRKEREEAIEEFNIAFSDPRVAEAEEIFVPVPRTRARHVSEPIRPDLSLFAPNPRTPTSPVTPSPKDSAKGESSDEFEAQDNPRNLPPGAFISTPKRITPSSASTLSSLTALSAFSEISHRPSDALSSAIPTKEAQPIKQEDIDAPPAHKLVKSRKAMIAQTGQALPLQPQAPVLFIPSSQPVLPTHPPLANMAAVPFRMPGRGTDKAPKFDGRDESLLIFIDDYEDLADQAGLAGADRIKGLIKYSRAPMTSIEAEGEYYREFTKVAQPLVAKDRVGKAEMNRLFLEGFPKDVQQQIHTRMMIKFPDHHPDDPYPIKDVRLAARFLLPGIASVAALPAGTQTSSPSPRTGNVQAPAYQKPTAGAVVKQEYQATRSGSYAAQGCMFCGSGEHFLSRCREKTAYIDAGKCKVSEESNKLVLPNGRWIPGKPHEGTLKERLDRHIATQQADQALPSASVTAGIFVRADPDVDAVIEVDSSAFVHTITDADSEVDDEDLEVQRATQALALATAKRDQKKGNGPYAPKGKAVRFDGVEVSGEPRARPGPASRQASDAVEIVSPAVQASSDKGKMPERAKTAATPSTSVAKPKETPKELMRT
ncbi:hypothetical protein DFJ58DRAFT_837665 [Suillus subalutaceus]|uniref:uncharacterized protein n=1 Tax=Suillus subalutaceus TaxID=48586 RepID=UPI001B86FCDC|nr:uncharacterized protein DFJ58DRAFT_837665 [Suillus subalutaceus]KAG1869358.1 hypothetical protein DFJ58DRAFT_837665 [Suillus subalutaceus]